jgi:curved DNA-binding protein
MVAVNVIDGNLKVRIPEGTQSGRQLRLSGKGIPSNPPGDLLLDIQVVLPAANTPKAKQLYETMAQELAFDPRNEPRRS